MFQEQNFHLETSGIPPVHWQEGWSTSLLIVANLKPEGLTTGIILYQTLKTSSL